MDRQIDRISRRLDRQAIGARIADEARVHLVNPHPDELIVRDRHKADILDRLDELGRDLVDAKLDDMLDRQSANTLRLQRLDVLWRRAVNAHADQVVDVDALVAERRQIARELGRNAMNARANDIIEREIGIMETWFIADPTWLARYFGSDFKPARVPAWPKLEDVAKADILRTLERATSDCSKAYSKGKVSFELLAGLDPTAVKAKCPNAKALLDRLRAM